MSEDYVPFQNSSKKDGLWNHTGNGGKAPWQSWVSFTIPGLSGHTALKGIMLPDVYNFAIKWCSAHLWVTEILCFILFEPKWWLWHTLKGREVSIAIGRPFYRQAFLTQKPSVMGHGLSLQPLISLLILWGLVCFAVLVLGSQWRDLRRPRQEFYQTACTSKYFLSESNFNIYLFIWGWAEVRRQLERISSQVKRLNSGQARWQHCHALNNSLASVFPMLMVLI